MLDEPGEVSISPPVCLHEFGESARQRLSDHGQNEHVRPEELLETRGELASLAGVEVLRLAEHNDAAIRQESRGEQRVDHGADNALVGVGRRRHSVFLDGDGEGRRAGAGVVVRLPGAVRGGELPDKAAYPAVYERRLAALYDEEDRGLRRTRVHVGSLSRPVEASCPVVLASGAESTIAAKRSLTLQVPATSWTRTSRQPPAIPSAAEANEALRRSPNPRSNSTPKKVLFEDDKSSG